MNRDIYMKISKNKMSILFFTTDLIIIIIIIIIIK